VVTGEKKYRCDKHAEEHNRSRGDAAKEKAA